MAETVEGRIEEIAEGIAEVGLSEMLPEAIYQLRDLLDIWISRMEPDTEPEEIELEAAD